MCLDRGDRIGMKVYAQLLRHGHTESRAEWIAAQVQRRASARQAEKRRARAAELPPAA